ncbi:ralBP1-associated Eps domain-containing protein 2 [Nematolebias whitei]|uniref:ralBP1-associated Eps domain-containing protein 2 n=1 Tax=Nematolebias whitei TaxID=451745 RepID=UPI00189A1870|nr:ralBP1-associated Eps domain-containing protein 2 [Nematolebias whitei]
MEQECAAVSGGSSVSLNEAEHRFYSGLHALCQAADSPGTLSCSKVAELFKASQLPPESLHKGPVHPKLQLSVEPDAGLVDGRDPHHADEDGESRGRGGGPHHPNQRHTPASCQQGPATAGSERDQVTEACGAKHLGYFDTPQFYLALKLLAATQAGLPVRLESVTASLPLPRFAGLKSEPEMRYAAAPAGTDGPGALCGSGPGSAVWTPADRFTFRHLETNADKKEPWSPPRSPCSSPPHSPHTPRSYLHTKQRNGVEPQTNIQLEQHFSPSRYMTNPTVLQAPAVERLSQQSALGYCDGDPWRITAEQLEYYTNQFKSLQSDLGALIPGAVVKNFFTKSKLPIPELSHIWELSDVDRDGALTFTEFCIAFHLIVARKNGYPLPDSLPPTLQPGFMQHEEEIPYTPNSAEPLIVFKDTEPRPCQMERSFAERLQLSSSASKHLHEQSIKEDLPHDADSQMKMKTRPRSYSSTSIKDAMKKAEEPPTPPPRPQKTHSRASSLDLNKLLQQGSPGVKSVWLLPPPALPPRPSTSQVAHFLNTSDKSCQNKVQQSNFADFSHFREEVGPNGKRVVTYYSWVLNKSERRYSVTWRKLLAVVVAWLISFREPEGQVDHWLEEFQSFNFTVEHRAGACHSNSDALSRHPCAATGCRHCEKQEERELTATDSTATDGTVQFLCRVFQVVDVMEWRAKQEHDPDLLPVLQWLKGEQQPNWDEVTGLSITTKGLWAKFDALRLSEGVLQCATGEERGHWTSLVPSSNSNQQEH